MTQRYREMMKNEDVESVNITAALPNADVSASSQFPDISSVATPLVPKMGRQTSRKVSMET